MRCVLLNGGTIHPGMEGRNGTLSITTAWQDGDPIPVELRNGALNIAITKNPWDGKPESGKLAITGDLTIGAGTSLVLNVNVAPGVTLEEGQKFTVVTANSIAEKGPRLFNGKIKTNDPRWNFTASVTPDAKAIVIEAEWVPQATTIIVR